jgi:hypothetical protein
LLENINQEGRIPDMPRRRMTRRMRRALRARRSLAPAFAGFLAAATLFACKGEETTARDAAASAPSETVAGTAPTSTPAAPIARIENPVEAAAEDPDAARDRAEIEARLSGAKTPDEIKDALSDLAVSLNPEAIPAASKYLTHADPDVVERAIEAMEQLGTEGAIPPLRDALGQGLSPILRIRVLEGLYYLRLEGNVMPALLVAFSDPDPRVRKEAAEYVGMLGDRKAEQPLRDRLAVETDPATMRSLDWAIRFCTDKTDDGPPKD